MRQAAFYGTLRAQGIRLFDHLGPELIKLEKMQVLSTIGITSLVFRVL